MSEMNSLFVRKKNIGTSIEGDSCEDPNDIWDDTMLIEAYDKAVQVALQGLDEVKNSDKSKKTSKKNEVEKWKVGDKCRCQYSEDLNYYEADIVDIMGSMCIVKYVGYENQEKISLKNLKQSKGDEARFKQIQNAEIDKHNNEEYNNLTDTNEVLWTANKSNLKKSQSKKKTAQKEKNVFPNSDSSTNFPFPQGLNSIIPPPPPPHMFRNLCEDENETEAMSAMLISWYMSGYHTGYYQGLKMSKKH